MLGHRALTHTHTCTHTHAHTHVHTVGAPGTCTPLARPPSRHRLEPWVLPGLQFLGVWWGERLQEAPLR